jgi:hypothetical protein
MLRRAFPPPPILLRFSQAYLKGGVETFFLSVDMGRVRTLARHHL